MFVAHFENTMRNAHPKLFVQPEIVRTIQQIRAEKRTAESRRIEIAMVEGCRIEEERKELSIKAIELYREINIRGIRSIRQIIQEVATIDVSYDAIIGKSRDRKIVNVRHAAIRAVWDARPDLSISHIGRHFNRDHTTILHALKKTGGTMNRGCFRWSFVPAAANHSNQHGHLSRGWQAPR
jgi:chromosomal replication initiation ATPase DnaA